MEEIRHKNKSETINEKLPTWDLSDLYSGIDDPQIESVIKELLEKADNFDKKYRGRINTPGLTPEFLLSAIKEYELIMQESAKPGAYAGLIFSADSKNPKHGAFLQKIESQILEIGQKLLFFGLELSNLDETILRQMAENPLLKNYKHYLYENLSWKPHRLSEAEEKILNDKDLSGRSAFERLFEEEMASSKFSIEIGGETKQLSQPEILHLLYSPNRSLRQKAAESFTLGLKENLRRLTFIFNTLVYDKSINDKYAKFSTPEANRHLSNEIDQKTIDVLNGAVTDNYGIARDFYDFKKETLNLDILYDYDRYAPISQSEKRVPFKKAKQIVLKSFGEFSPRFFGIAKEFFDKKWIDAALKDGKNGGAFCFPISPDAHPYALLNYKSGIKDVKTLAHELGHAIHGRLSQEQTYLNYGHTLTLAETASIFSEMLVFDKLKNSLADNKEKFALYVSTIEEMFAAAFRQISMYRFEKELHFNRREKGELLPEEINTMWRKTQKEMFGDSVKLTENYDIWWSYIPHFVRSPFYVYAYAFGQLLTLSLYAKYKNGESGFEEKFINLLKSGQSKSPQELLAPLGINLEDKNFWQEGINIIKKMVSEAKDIYRSFAK